MNKFAWSITFKWNIELKYENISFNFVKNLTKAWDSNIFYYWETSEKTSKDLFDYLSKDMWEVIAKDISISTEDKLEIFSDETLDGEYSIMSISWVNNSFQEVLEWFSEWEEVVSIRQAEDSKAFWNRVIKVDIISV